MSKRPLCLCGCGELVNRSQNYKGWNKYVRGHHMRSKANKERVAAIGRKFFNSYNKSQKHREEARETMQKLNADPDHRKKIIRGLAKVDRVDLVARNKSSEHRALLKELWTTDEYVEKIMASRRNLPSKPEVSLMEMAPDNIRYTGDGSWWRRFPNGLCKNPDFKVTHQKKVIEVFGEYWHDNQEACMVIEMFHRIGYECLLIWDYEINKSPETVKEMVDLFAEDN